MRATGYEALFRDLAPLLEVGQVVSLYPDHFGSLILRRIMRQTGCRAEVIIGGWSSLPYGCRNMGRDPVSEAFVLYRAVTLRGDALPGADRARLKGIEWE